MSATPLLLNGKSEPQYGEGPDVVTVMRGQINRLERRLDDVEASRDLIKRDAVVIVLNMLAKSLRMVASGELDLDITDGAVAVAGVNPRWDAIKRSLPPRLAQAIDVLLTQGPKTNMQLAAAMRMDRTNCNNNVTLKLKQMGLIVKNGNEYSVKDLA
jgi:hypothetical protein